MEITTEKKSDDKTTQPEEIILNIQTVTSSNTILSSSNTIDMIERTTTPTITESTIFDLNDDSGKEQRGGKATTLRLETTTAMSSQRGAPPEPPELSEDIEEVEEEKEIEITNATSTSKKSNHPFIRYFRRLRKIYELDLKILDQIASLLEGINDELLPQVADALEPLLVSQTVNMLDLGQILGYVAQTIHSTKFQLGASTSLGGLDFLKFGKFKKLLI